MDFDDRIVNGGILEEDIAQEPGLRPRSLDEYIGQSKAKENLSVYIEAAKARKEALDHVLLYGRRDWEKRHLQTSLQMSSE